MAVVPKDGLLSNFVASIRKCLGNALRGEPPEPAAEVLDLLHSLQMTPRQAYNRDITIDFFRHKKVTTISELITGAQSASAPRPFLPQKYFNYQLGPPDEGPGQTREQQISWVLAEVKQNMDVADCVHLPLGPSPPPRQKPELEVALPVWLKEHLKLNEDPIKGVPLGSAAYVSPRGEQRPWAGDAAVRPIADTKAAILQSFGPPLVRQKRGNEFVILRHPRPSSERLEAVARSQELEFIRKSRRGEAKRDNMVRILERHCSAALVDRPVKRVQGHL